jgi:hypothetical protein
MVLVNPSLELAIYLDFKLEINIDRLFKPKAIYRIYALHPFTMSTSQWFFEILYYIILVLNLRHLARKLYSVWKLPQHKKFFKCDDELKNEDLFTRFLNYPISQSNSMLHLSKLAFKRSFALFKRIYYTIIYYLITQFYAAAFVSHH